jgi:hypothetical protein
MELGVVEYLSWSSTLNHCYLKTSARFAKEMGGVLAIYTGVHVIDRLVTEVPRSSVYNLAFSHSYCRAKS